MKSAAFASFRAAAVAAVLFAPFAAQAKPAGDAELRVRAMWRELREPGDVLGTKTPVLMLRVENQESRAVAIEVAGNVNRDGLTVPLSTFRQTLNAFEGRDMALKFTPSQLGVANLRYSGRVTVTVEARTGTQGGRLSIGLPAVFYHPDKEEIVFYGRKALLERYAAGNFRRERIDTSVPERQAREALIPMRLPALQVAPARITRARLRPTVNDFAADLRRFCLVMPGWPYLDSGFGEDFGRVAQTIPMTRGWVVIGQAGNSLFSGFLDATGCTPSLAAAPNVETLLVFSPIYLHTGRNIRGFGSDLNLGSEWPATMPLSFFTFVSPNTQTVVVEADTSEETQTIFAAAAQGMERFAGGLTNVLYEFRLREEGDNTGTATDYAPEGHPRVNIKFSNAARSKFTVVHEYGHAVLMAKLSPPITPADLDYSVENGEAQQHTVTSKEWQLAAALEGFAHFVSGVAWNQVAANGDAVFVADQAYSLGVFGKYFETNFNEASFPDQGVELDWAQFFWNYHTDTPGIPGVAPPSQSTLVAMFLASYPWPKNAGFFADFSAGAFAVLPPAPPLAAYQWFLVEASQAGIVH